jgi:hypothetical protein
MLEYAPFVSHAPARVPTEPISTPFGTYYVGSGPHPPELEPYVEQVTFDQYRRIQDAYDSIVSGRGNLQIRDHFERPRHWDSDPETGQITARRRGRRCRDFATTH